MEYTTAMARLGFKVFELETGAPDKLVDILQFMERTRRISPRLIDHISATYPEANKTHIAVSGFSLGAGQMLLSSSIRQSYLLFSIISPPTNVSGLLSDIGVSYILGTNSF